MLMKMSELNRQIHGEVDQIQLEVGIVFKIRIRNRITKRILIASSVLAGVIVLIGLSAF